MKRALMLGLLLAVVPISPALLDAQEECDSVLHPFVYKGTKPPVAWTAPSPGDSRQPIDLATALRLVGSRSLDVAIAAQRIRQASAQHDQARYAWLPTISMGPDYYRHDGAFQDVFGNPVIATRTSFAVGLGINAWVTPSDAIFAPLAIRQVERSRQADLDTAANNALLTVAEAYFTVQQARGELAGAEDAVRHTQELVRRTEKLALGLAPPVEAVRARAELARRRQAIASARERWETNSAELVRVLRLDPLAVVDPLEPPHHRVALVAIDHAIDTLIPVGLRNRPELASQQALVEATIQRLRQERLRPLLPSIVLRGVGPGNSTVSEFGAGNTALRNYGIRGDVDLQVVWELQNLGLGNLAKIRERQADNQVALLELFRLQDRVAAEVVQAHAQAKAAANRLADAEAELKDAADSVEKNFQGLSQTRRAGDLIILMIRPQEVVAAIGALSQAYTDFYGAIADYNRAQFRLFRALGYPAQIFVCER